MAHQDESTVHTPRYQAGRRRCRARTTGYPVALWSALLWMGCGAAPPHGATTAESADAELEWSPWSRETFERARREDRPILLSVQAGWCHWCHVMNETTYRDPAVIRRMNDGFIRVRADADARPDLQERYRRWGWPATIFLSPGGERILALRGYRSPRRFETILDEVARAHREGRTLETEDDDDAETPSALREVRETVRAQLDRMYDVEAGGWGRRQRYPFAEPVEHALFREAVHGEPGWRERALHTLDRYAELIDPVWGGMYQYSVGGRWDRPHFEKIIPVQAGAIVAFTEAYRATGERRWLERAGAVHRYLIDFLRATDGRFYASQDADLRPEDGGRTIEGAQLYALNDAERRELGVPRVDRHIYASLNGMVIEALARLAAAAGQQAPLAHATRAMERLRNTHHDEATGLFRHGTSEEDPLFHLADQAYPLRALVALHQATGQPRWLEQAGALARAVEGALATSEGGFAAHTRDPRSGDLLGSPRVPIEENAVVARGLLSLGRLQGDPHWREVAERALVACARPAELQSLGRIVGQYLLALEELAAGHLLLSVVGPDSPGTEALRRAAVQQPQPNRLVEVGRPGASRYPFPGRPAIFLCSEEACSMPVFTPEDLGAAIERFIRPPNAR